MIEFNRTKYTNCKDCPLNSMNKVFGRGDEDRNFNSGIIFLGEAPGVEEDRQKKPFVGQSGKLLDLVLHEVGIHRDYCWITNRIICRPPQNNFNADGLPEAISLCSHGLFQEFKYLREEAGYKIIVPLGANALGAFKLKGIKRYKGQVINDIDLDMKVIPTYHPSYLVRNGGKILKEENNELWESWKKDFELVKEISNA
jgi:DNA polymerase